VFCFVANFHIMTTKTQFVSHCDLAIYIKMYLKAKQELWKLIYVADPPFSCACVRMCEDGGRWQSFYFSGEKSPKGNTDPNFGQKMLFCVAKFRPVLTLGGVGGRGVCRHRPVYRLHI
jgi:hypothetical protein